MLLLGVLRAGARYYVCPAMSVVLDAPCCGEHDEGEDEDDRAALRCAGCCSAKRLASMPTSAVPASAEVAASPCVAFLPARIDGGGVRAAATVVRFTQPARAGPATPTERRADLMVWLI